MDYVEIRPACPYGVDYAGFRSACPAPDDIWMVFGRDRLEFNVLDDVEIRPACPAPTGCGISSVSTLFDGYRQIMFHCLVTTRHLKNQRNRSVVMVERPRLGQFVPCYGNAVG